jgi:hypothetical protein
MLKDIAKAIPYEIDDQEIKSFLQKCSTGSGILSSA